MIIPSWGDMGSKKMEPPIWWSNFAEIVVALDHSCLVLFVVLFIVIHGDSMHFRDPLFIFEVEAATGIALKSRNRSTSHSMFANVCKLVGLNCFVSMYIHIYHRGTPAKKVTIANWSRSETSPCLAWSIDIPSTLTALTLTAGSAAEKNHMQGWDGMIPRPLDIPDWKKANKTCVFSQCCLWCFTALWNWFWLLYWTILFLYNI